MWRRDQPAPANVFLPVHEVDGMYSDKAREEKAKLTLNNMFLAGVCAGETPIQRDTWRRMCWRWRSQPLSFIPRVWNLHGWGSLRNAGIPFC